MKMKVLLIMSLCIVLLAGGCGKKDVTSELDPTENTTTDNEDTTDTGVTEGTDINAPTKGEYELKEYITLGEYKGIEVTVEKLVVTEADIDAAIQADLDANATEEEVTGRAVVNGDIVNIDYEGLKGGVAFEGGTAQDYDLIIGSGSFIPGFEDQIIGANIGDKLALDITFPTDYSSPDLAGQAVIFNVTVNAIKKSIKAELTEEFVKTNTEYETIEAYKEGNRATLQLAKEEEMKSAKTNSVLSVIVENSVIAETFPQTLIDYYKYEMKAYYTQYASMFGMDFAGFLAASQMTEESFDAETQAYAENRVTQELVIKAIIEEEGMELSEEEYKEGLAKIVADYGYASEDELLQSASVEQIKESLLWEKALNFVTEQAVEL